MNIRKSLVVQEYSDYDISSIFEISTESKIIDIFEKEVYVKSTRIKKDLGLRFDPLEISFSGGRRYLRFAGISGLLILFNRTIQIIPKFFRGSTSEGDWQTSILRMLSRARNSAFTYSKAELTGKSNVSFIDHIALAYSDVLEFALNMEPIQVYKTSRENSYYLTRNNRSNWFNR